MRLMISESSVLILSSIATFRSALCEVTLMHSSIVMPSDVLMWI